MPKPLISYGQRVLLEQHRWWWYLTILAAVVVSILWTSPTH